MSQPVISIANVSKIFDGGDNRVVALDNVTMHVDRGEMLAIMGPSGSGKSTLMTIIGLLDVPSSGRYLLDGIDTSELDRSAQAAVRNQKLGFIFQNFNLLPRLNALQNVALPMVYARVPPAERDARARAALEAVGLGNRLTNRPNELSGGQKQRVAVARALVNNPALLLADEPTGALDSRTGHEIMELFRQLNREQGITVIIVTHDAEIGKQMDRIVSLRDGQLNLQALHDYYGIQTDDHGCVLSHQREASYVG
ncbi:MAG: ABC transporter ATP-binding protein [Chloroflexi bacterium]|nr:ABC transporter ATP-binding protein [Chloroflexota bacterium]